MTTSQSRNYPSVLVTGFAALMLDGGTDPEQQPIPYTLTPLADAALRTPLIVVTLDEADQVSHDPACRQLLSDIASKCRPGADVRLIVADENQDDEARQ